MDIDQPLPGHHPREIGRLPAPSDLPHRPPSRERAGKRMGRTDTGNRADDA